MIFVEESVDDDQDRGNQEPAWRSAERPGCYKPENRVLSEVREFSYDEVNGRERFRRRVRKQPEYEWSNNARGVSGAEVVSGSEEDKREPDYKRKITA